jgi:hypothetical protein
MLVAEQAFELMSFSIGRMLPMNLVLAAIACGHAGDDGTAHDGAEVAVASGGATSTAAETTSTSAATQSTATTGSGALTSSGVTGVSGGPNSVTSGAVSTAQGGAGGAGGGGASTTNDAGSGAGGTAGQDASGCDAPSLEWRSGKKTNYTSYPDPGSEECVKYNGCMWAGWFAHCEEQQSEQWVESHNIAAMFPDAGYERHDICIRSGDRSMIVTVYDTCGDSDCDGCCTENKGEADALIDLESFTNERWGLPDGDLEWADLGPTAGEGCE